MPCSTHRQGSVVTKTLQQKPNLMHIWGNCYMTVNMNLLQAPIDGALQNPGSPTIDVSRSRTLGNVTHGNEHILSFARTLQTQKFDLELVQTQGMSWAIVQHPRHQSASKRPRSSAQIHINK